MANDFSVEVGTLNNLSGQLKSIGDTVGGAQGGLDGLGDGQTGHGDLSSAVHHFKDKWEYSLKKINETAQAVAEKTTAAAQGYTEVDTAIADAAAGRS